MVNKFLQKWIASMRKFCNRDGERIMTATVRNSQLLRLPGCYRYLNALMQLKECRNALTLQKIGIVIIEFSEYTDH